MKITSSFLKILFCAILLCSAIIKCNEDRSYNYQDVEISKNYSFILGPRVAHIQNNFEKLVRPLVEKPFLPEEVEKLASLKRKKVFYDDVMATAKIVGDQNYQPGEVEKPSIYTSVFENHKTSVIHPQPQPINVPLPNKETAFIFSSEGSQQTGNQLLLDQISNHLSIPVNLGSLGSDPTLKGYETPNYQKSRESEESMFLEKAKKVKSETKFVEMAPEEAMETDIKTFLKQFENTHDKSDKLKTIQDGKARLLKDVKEIKDAISSHLADLMDAKKLAIKLNNLVHKYEKKAVEDEKAENLKLADEITVKELLKDKLHREIQGLRVSSGEYKELELVNPEDITTITKHILEKLGPY